jgi:hypothetical protein
MKPLLRNFVPTQRLKKFRKADEGQALVLAVLGMVVLLMMAGLGVDVGYLHYQRQQMQKAADAGALAGAAALIYGGNYTAAAQNDTAANGFTNNTNGITVTVNNPPAPGDPFAGLPGYVQVIVAQARPTFFMRIGGFNSVNVAASAVASAVANSSACIDVLDPTDPQSLLIDGNVSIGASCGIYVESNSNDALHKNGASGSVKASYIGVVGKDQTNGGFQFQCSSNTGGASCPATGIATFLDPFLNVPAPPVASGCQQPTGPNGTNYPAGTYCNPINISSGGPYTFGPGVITVEGPLNITGTPILNGTGVQFYLTCSTPGNCASNGGTYGGINIGGNVTVNWTAPTTGAQAGILFFQDRSVPVGSASSSFFGNNSANFSGALYFPTTKLQYKGTPGFSDATILVAWQLVLNGDAQLTDSLLPNGGSPLRSALLVE